MATRGSPVAVLEGSADLSFAAAGAERVLRGCPQKDGSGAMWQEKQSSEPVAGERGPCDGSG